MRKMKPVMDGLTFSKITPYESWVYRCPICNADTYGDKWQCQKLLEEHYEKHCKSGEILT
jgi:hypothetical protein